MIDFQEVMQRVRTILLQERKQTKVLDRDIATALDLDPQYFSVIKKRKKIPFVHLAYFCKAHKISMNWVLMEQKPQYLK